MIEIDGSYGEGGGQILRTALLLSVITQQPFRMANIREGRPSPGLKQEHLACVSLLRQLTDAEVEGEVLGSTQMAFSPKALSTKELEIVMPTAASIPLVLQCVGIPLIKSSSTLTIVGGTDVKWSPTADYFREVIAPAYKPFGSLSVDILKRGYFPQGQGKAIVRGVASESIAPFRLLEKEGIPRIHGTLVAHPQLSKPQVLERVAAVIKKAFPDANLSLRYADAPCPGMSASLFASYGNCVLGADVLGEPGVMSEKLGQQLVDKLKKEMADSAPVDEHLADNLIPVLALLGGEFRTTQVSNHTHTNIYVAQLFSQKRFEVGKELVIRAA